jgi:phosphoenolpyruvate synthase/pyruvate phosphate dikinase
MQVRAIIEAAVNVAKEGVKVHPHIMIPLVGIEDELIGQAKIVTEVAAQVFAATGGYKGLKLTGKLCCVFASTIWCTMLYG